MNMIVNDEEHELGGHLWRARNTVSSRELLYKIFLRFPLFLTCATIVPIVALTLTYLIPPIYKSTAQVLIRYDKPDTALFGEIATPLSQQISGQSNAEIMQSLPICLKIVKALNVQKEDIAQASYKVLLSKVARITSWLWPGEINLNEEEKDDSLQLAGDLKESISAKIIQKSRPELQVIDELIEIEVKSFNIKKVAQITNGFCNAFIDEYYRLGEARAQQAYKYLTQQTVKISEAMGKENGAYLDASVQQKLADFSDRKISTNPLVDSAAKQVVELEFVVAKLKSIYSDKAPELVKAQQDLQKARELMRDHESLESAKLLLSLFKERRQQAYMTVELYKNRLIPVSIVEEAATPKYSRTLIIGRYVIFGSIGLVIGLVLGLTLVMFYSAIDSRIFTPWGVEKECDLQVIGSFPAISANKAQSLSVWDFRLSEFAPTALQVLGRLDLIGWKQGQIMLVTSASIGEGKTTTALQIMAALIRDKETRVLLVDGNFYRPELTRLFGKADQSGIVDVLKGLAEIKEVIRSTEAENLNFISVGRIDNRLELGFFKKSLNRSLNEIRSNYDLILIDSSDVLSSTESTVFASESDRVLMVIKAGSTRRALLVNTLSALEHASRRPFGAILNFRRFPIPKIFYGLW